MGYSYSDGNYYTFKINTVPNSIKDLYDKYYLKYGDNNWDLDSDGNILVELNSISDSDLRDISDIFNYLYNDIYKYNDNNLCNYDKPVIDLVFPGAVAPVAIFASNFNEGPNSNGLFSIEFNFHV